MTARGDTMAGTPAPPNPGPPMFVRFAQFPVVAAIALAVAVGGQTEAIAHKLEVKAVVSPPAAGEPAFVTVEAWYEFGDAVEGTATLTGPDGAELGRAALTSDVESVQIPMPSPMPNPMPGTYTVTVDDGAGHRSKVSFTLSVDAPTASGVTERRNRWLMGGLGLAVIAGLTVAARKIARKSTAPEARPS